MVMTKIPEKIRRRVTKKIGKENWELDQVLANLRTELEAREACGQLCVGTDSSYFKSNPIVPQLKRCLKFVAIRLIKRFKFKQRDIKDPCVLLFGE